MKHLLTLLCICGLSAQAENTITEREWLFSSDFEFESGDTAQVRITKEPLSVRTHYDLFDEEENFLGSATIRFFSLGQLFWTCSTMDIHDAEGKWIGMVDGKVLSSAGAKYLIYDKLTHVATVYMDYRGAEFTILSPKTNKKIGHLRKESIESPSFYHPTSSYRWRTKIFDESAIDSRILQLFSAMAVDSWSPGVIKTILIAGGSKSSMPSFQNR